MDDDEVVKDINSSDLLELFALVPKIIVWGSREIWARCTGGYRIYEDGSTSLHWAARDGKLNTVEYFIKNKEEKRVDVNKADKDGKTALHVAIDRRHVEVVRALIAAGADVNTTNKYGYTPLHSALPDINENEEQRKSATLLVEILIAAEADADKPNQYGETPLYKMAGGCLGWDVEDPLGTDSYFAAIEALVKAEVDVNRSGGSGQTPLYWIAKKGHVKAAEVLIAAGADVNKGSSEGDSYNKRSGLTPLYMAAKKEHLEFVKVLIAAGADVNKTAEYKFYGDDNAPLHVAVKIGCIAVIKELIEHGADIKDSNNEDALCYVLSKSRRGEFSYHEREIVKLLILSALLGNSDRKIDCSIRKDNDLLTSWNAISQEITRMRDEKIPGGGCSFYDFLKTSLDELANTISQNSFNAFKSFSLVEVFPHFSVLLQNRLEKLKPLIEKRAKLLEISSSNKFSLSSKDNGSKVQVLLVPDTLRKIFEFLPNKAIEAVVAASLPIRSSTFFKSPDETQGEHAQGSCNTESRRALRRCGF